MKLELTILRSSVILIVAHWLRLILPDVWSIKYASSKPGQKSKMWSNLMGAFFLYIELMDRTGFVGGKTLPKWKWHLKALASFRLLNFSTPLDYISLITRVLSWGTFTCRGSTSTACSRVFPFGYSRATWMSTLTSGPPAAYIRGLSPSCHSAVQQVLKGTKLNLGHIANPGHPQTPMSLHLFTHAHL